MTTEVRIVLAVIIVLLTGIFWQTFTIIDRQESEIVMLENIYAKPTQGE